MHQEPISLCQLYNFILFFQGNLIIPGLTATAVVPNQTLNQTPVKVQPTSVASVTTTPQQLPPPMPSPVTTVDTTISSPESPTIKTDLQSLQLPPVSTFYQLMITSTPPPPPPPPKKLPPPMPSPVTTVDTTISSPESPTIKTDLQSLQLPPVSTLY